MGTSLRLDRPPVQMPGCAYKTMAMTLLIIQAYACDPGSNNRPVDL
jgi:hypothetical protein